MTDHPSKKTFEELVAELETRVGNAVRDYVQTVEAERDQSRSTLRFCEGEWAKTDAVTLDKLIEARTRAETAEATVLALKAENERLAKALEPLPGEPDDAWAEAYCALTNRDPDGAQTTFMSDGPVTITFREKAKREIAAAIAAAPTSATSPLPSEGEKRMREALTEIRKSIRNAMGAIESNQVVDKDVHGTLKSVLARIDALSYQSGNGEGRE